MTSSAPSERTSSTAPAARPSSARAVHAEDDVPCFHAGLHVPRRLDHVLERIAPVDHCAILAGLDQPLEEEDVLTPVPGDAELQPPVADPRGQHVEGVPEAVRRDEDSAPLERAAAAEKRELADGVEDDVVCLVVLGEVVAGVVNRPVGAECARKLERLRVADGRYLSAVVP